MPPLKPLFVMKTVRAGTFPSELIETCALFEVQPQSLLGWSVSREQVVVILPDGRKARAAVRGVWTGASKSSKKGD